MTTRFACISFVFALGIVAARADLVLEQRFSDATSSRTVITKIQGSKMRMDQPNDGFSVIVDFKTRDSYTLLTNQTYLFKFGSEVRWEMKEEQKYTHGTNDLDFPPAPAVDTGKSEKIDGYDAELFTWSGAHGLQETLWVARQFPNFNEIRLELFKLDQFNDAGPHRNAQPRLALLPGMVLKSETVLLGRPMTNLLVSAKVEPLDKSLFELPRGYSVWKPPQNKNNQTNSSPH